MITHVSKRRVSNRSAWAETSHKGAAWRTNVPKHFVTVATPIRSGLDRLNSAGSTWEGRVSRGWNTAFSNGPRLPRSRFCELQTPTRRDTQKPNFALGSNYMRGKYLEGRPWASRDRLWHECQCRSFCLLFSIPSIVLDPLQVSMFGQNSQTVCTTQLSSSPCTKHKKN